MKKSFKKLVSTLGIMTLFVAPVVTTTMLSVSEQGVQASHKGHKNHKTDWKGIAFKMGQMTPEQADIEFGTRRIHDDDSTTWIQKVGKRELVREDSYGNVTVSLKNNATKGLSKFAPDRIYYMTPEDTDTHVAPSTPYSHLTGDLSEDEIDEEGRNISGENQWHANEYFGQGFWNKHHDLQWNIQIGNQKFVRIDSVNSRQAAWGNDVYAVDDFNDKLTMDNWITGGRS